jgi:hypothetical protein
LQTAVYLNRCSNQLLQFELPDITGFSGVTQNLNATLQNSGLEFLLNTINVDTRAFQWRSTFNLTLPNSKLISYPGLEQSADASKYAVGQPINMVRVFHYMGVDPKTGLYQVKDVDGNGSLIFYGATASENDTFLKPIGREYYGGVNNSLVYKGIELSFLFQFAVQTAQNPIFVIPGNVLSNLREDVINNYWKKDGDIKKYGKPSAIPYATYEANNSDATITNSSFVRLKTLSLSYSLSSAVCDRMKLQSAKIYMQGQNLMTFSKSVTLDPEVGLYALPPLRLVTIGVEVKL